MKDFKTDSSPKNLHCHVPNYKIGDPKQKIYLSAV